MSNGDTRTLSLNISLSKDDWDPRLKGWRCQALALPGAKLTDLYVNGDPEHATRYAVISGQPPVVRLTDGSSPEHAVAVLSLTEELSTKKQVDRWKKIAIVLAPVAGLLGTAITDLPKWKGFFTRAAQATGVAYKPDCTPPLTNDSDVRCFDN